MANYAAKASPSPRFLNTKWDARNWTEEQKDAFLEECYRLGYNWPLGVSTIRRLDYDKAYRIYDNGQLGYWSGDAYNFKEPRFGTEKKWEDMFPDSSTEVVSHSQGTLDHDCLFHYSRVQNCCLKCHPEKNLFNKNLYTVKGMDSVREGIPEPSAIRSATDLWGILDTARREREFI